MVKLMTALIQASGQSQVQVHIFHSLENGPGNTEESKKDHQTLTDFAVSEQVSSTDGIVMEEASSSHCFSLSVSITPALSEISYSKSGWGESCTMVLLRSDVEEAVLYIVCTFLAFQSVTPASSVNPLKCQGCGTPWKHYK